jgi:hypothetical protein
MRKVSFGTYAISEKKAVRAIMKYHVYADYYFLVWRRNRRRGAQKAVTERPHADPVAIKQPLHLFVQLSESTPTCNERSTS